MTSPSLRGKSARRVLIVTNMYPTATDPVFGSFVSTQVRSLEEIGVDPEVVFIDGRQRDSNYLRGIGAVRKHLAQGHFDLVHAHYGLTGLMAAWHTKPLVVSFCGDDLLGTPDGAGGVTVKSRVGQALSWCAAWRADQIICKSDGLRSALPVPAWRLRAHVIPNGVNTAIFSPGKRGEARRRLGVSLEDRLILFPHSRRQTAVKRFDLAEAAVAMLGERVGCARLWVVNDRSPREMPTYYQAADCMLLTSDHEGSPNTVKEAICCDLPVVSVDVGDVRQWMGMAVGCRVVERDPKSISEGLEAVLKACPHVDGGAVRGKIGLEAIARRLAAVYDQALGDHSR